MLSILTRWRPPMLMQCSRKHKTDFFLLHHSFSLISPGLFGSSKMCVLFLKFNSSLLTAVCSAFHIDFSRSPRARTHIRCISILKSSLRLMNSFLPSLASSTPLFVYDVDDGWDFSIFERSILLPACLPPTSTWSSTAAHISTALLIQIIFRYYFHFPCVLFSLWNSAAAELVGCIVLSLYRYHKREALTDCRAVTSLTPFFSTHQ